MLRDIEDMVGNISAISQETQQNDEVNDHNVLSHLKLYLVSLG